MDGELVLRKQTLNAKPFKKMNVDKVLVNKFVTMDIETIKVNGLLKPYLICAYDGVDYITTYQTSTTMDQEALFSLFYNNLLTFFKNKQDKLVVYAHNFSGFDGIFLLKHLLNFGKVTPLIFNGKLMCVTLKITSGIYKGKVIVFKDSYLMLPQSLRMLCAAFKLVVPKGYFPFKLNNIFYFGILPHFELVFL
jgi:hypothetical protein